MGGPAQWLLILFPSCLSGEHWAPTKLALPPPFSFANCSLINFQIHPHTPSFDKGFFKPVTPSFCRSPALFVIATSCRAQQLPAGCTHIRPQAGPAGGLCLVHI